MSGATGSGAAASEAARGRPRRRDGLRVVDNHGDLGVCWRLARDLAARGEAVRLWVDDARALAWMAPATRRPPSSRPWPARRSRPARTAAAPRRGSTSST
ncbi:elongation factor P maturation arginine rhamnosyltransferase EarP [Piscinibacter sakaiensis]|uniref:elongation factor P maturation arginine rhamnosyltransferase EarP n=1 Tax=Piscinibacter sakaiensis TaxID=1547922 RepID=UPI003728CB81